MKKIILLILLAFTSTTFVHATLLDDKIETYKNIITQISDNILSDSPNHDLLPILKEQSDTLMNEIKNIHQNDMNKIISSIQVNPHLTSVTENEKMTLNNKIIDLSETPRGKPRGISLLQASLPSI
jgi:hypothetical protein